MKGEGQVSCVLRDSANFLRGWTKRRCLGVDWGFTCRKLRDGACFHGYIRDRQRRQHSHARRQIRSAGWRDPHRGWNSTGSLGGNVTVAAANGQVGGTVSISSGLGVAGGAAGNVSVCVANASSGSGGWLTVTAGNSKQAKGGALGCMPVHRHVRRAARSR